MTDRLDHSEIACRLGSPSPVSWVSAGPPSVGPRPLDGRRRRRRLPRPSCRAGPHPPLRKARGGQRVGGGKPARWLRRLRWAFQRTRKAGSRPGRQAYSVPAPDALCLRGFCCGGTDCSGRGRLEGGRLHPGLSGGRRRRLPTAAAAAGYADGGLSRILRCSSVPPHFRRPGESRLSLAQSPARPRPGHDDRHGDAT